MCALAPDVGLHERKPVPGREEAALEPVGLRALRHRSHVVGELGWPCGEGLVPQIGRRIVARRRFNAVDQVAQRGRLTIDLDLEATVILLEECGRPLAQGPPVRNSISHNDRAERIQILMRELALGSGPLDARSDQSIACGSPESVSKDALSSAARTWTYGSLSMLSPSAPSGPMCSITNAAPRSSIPPTLRRSGAMPRSEETRRRARGRTRARSA